jgi:ribosomal-protein-alanine N-acetyltransferase
MNIPSLDTPHLLLRGFYPADFEPLCAILSDREVLRYLPRTEPYPPEAVERIIQRQAAHWEKFGFGWYAVQDRQSAELIGWCGLGVLEETDETEIKYLLKRSHWGLGLATEAARPCLAAGFSRYALDEIIGLVHPGNAASRRVLEKLGPVYRDRVHYWGMDLDRLALTKAGYLSRATGGKP